MYGQGISYNGELVDLGVKSEVIEKSGSWYSYKEERIGQGRENVKQYLTEHPDIADNIGAEIKEKLGIGADLNDIEQDITEDQEKSINSAE